uniref:SIR2 family protein n=1 Tax=Flavobacterium sp. TaxID=239 RepID=UPI00404B23F8
MSKKIYDDLKKAINEKNPCFVIGNGINRFKQHNSEGDVSWEGILLKIYNDFSSKKRNFIPEGVALPEFFDIIDLVKEGKVKTSLQKEFADKLDWQPKPHHMNIVSKIKERNAQIITTNFDFVLQKSINAEMFRHRVSGLRLMSDFYPWDTYFSDSEKKDPFNAFSIWHMHGQKNYHRSIKLGLNQYMSMVERSKRYFPKTNKDESDKEYQTWVKLFFEKDLIIMGLSLNEQEIFFRWLLLQRAKYFKRRPELKKAGFYINHAESDKHNVGKKFFMKSVGIDYVDFIGDFDGFYHDFWNEI